MLQSVGANRVGKEERRPFLHWIKHSTEMSGSFIRCYSPPPLLFYCPCPTPQYYSHCGEITGSFTSMLRSREELPSNTVWGYGDTVAGVGG